MGIRLRFNRKQDKIVITLPVEELHPSTTGTTLILASSHGAQKDELTYSGRSVYANVNCFVYPEGAARGKRGKAKPRSTSKEEKSPEAQGDME